VGGCSFCPASTDSRLSIVPTPSNPQKQIKTGPLRPSLYRKPPQALLPPPLQQQQRPQALPLLPTPPPKISSHTPQKTMSHLPPSCPPRVLAPPPARTRPSTPAAQAAAARRSGFTGRGRRICRRRVIGRLGSWHVSPGWSVVVGWLWLGSWLVGWLGGWLGSWVVVGVGGWVPKSNLHPIHNAPLNPPPALMANFELNEDRLMLLLRWLVAAAPRLRAHLARVLLLLGEGLEQGNEGAGALAPPEGLLEEFPAELVMQVGGCARGLLLDQGSRELHVAVGCCLRSWQRHKPTPDC